VSSSASGDVLGLVRLHGQPIGFVQAQVAEPVETLDTLADAARAELADAIAGHLAEDRKEADPFASGPNGFRPWCLRRRLRVLAQAPAISVVIATRERPAQLARCLESVGRLSYPDHEVIVVDNDPETDAAERLVRDRFGFAVTYVREPRRGLAAAHNRGLAVAGGQIVAFTDDDVIVDQDWLTAVAEGFAAHEDVGCVTGLIVPAELETPAQIMLESRGGFAKGFAQHHYSGREASDDPLFPFTAGRFGSGANMSFSASMLRALGGFDPATGVGSAARGGDDLLAFFRTIAAGKGLVYQPGSIVWHHHARTAAALERQAYGYGVGLGAYLAAALSHEPRMLPSLLRRIPRGFVYALEQTRSRGQKDTVGWTRRLSTAQRRGLLYGPFAYARSRYTGRKAGTAP
jgi:GT2 family glycosyltransferase